jgi:hypothetical protein
VTGSELAFLGLGLVLGAATGAALIVVVGNRAPGREIRVTVTRNALPGRSETLSQDAFVTRPAEPAPGGPGDRRSWDRVGAAPQPVAIPIHGGTGGWFPEPVAPVAAAVANPVVTRVADRTVVPSWGTENRVVGIAIEPEGDPVLEAATMRQPGRGTALERMLRGEHRAMLEVVDRIAGDDDHRRRDWEVLLGAFVEGMADVAVEESIIDFPMGTPFWDTFTVEQCRHIVTALASMGYRYDGRSGWIDGRVPTYRDLAKALADIGVDPIRIRAWPNQLEISALFVGTRPAPEELIAAAGPEYATDSVRALLGERGPELANLWLAWDAIRPAMLAEDVPGPAQNAAAVAENASGSALGA